MNCKTNKTEEKKTADMENVKDQNNKTNDNNKDAADQNNNTNNINIVSKISVSFNKKDVKNLTTYSSKYNNSNYSIEKFTASFDIIVNNKKFTLKNLSAAHMIKDDIIQSTIILNDIKSVFVNKIHYDEVYEISNIYADYKYGIDDENNLACFTMISLCNNLLIEKILFNNSWHVIRIDNEDGVVSLIQNVSLCNTTNNKYTKEILQIRYTLPINGCILMRYHYCDVLSMCLMPISDYEGIGVKIVNNKPEFYSFNRRIN